MKEYLLLFWNESGDGQYKIDSEKMRESMQAWQNWIGQIALQGNLISTKPIQFTGSTVGGDTGSKKPVILDGQMVTGYMLCKAKDLEEVEQWAKNCPIYTHHQGFTEIREVAPFEL